VENDVDNYLGLITAYQLARFSNPASPITVQVIEKHSKSSQDNYGRAITLYSRSCEMLDQLGLAEELAQSCFACRASGTYNAKGESIPGRGWKFMEEVTDTTWDFALVLRQKYQEEIFRRRLRKYGVRLHATAELDSIDVDESVPIGSHRVTATILDGTTKETFTITSRYLIGCDGGRSTVRRLASIPFDGDSSEDKWVRVDGVVSHTNNPTPRAYCAIESSTHGNVLWAPLDHGGTRIGFAFTPERQKGYEVFDQAAAEKEAVLSVKPLEIEFSQVDWYTVYAVGQRVARTFSSKSCIFLAGDACHTHSSGAAQGMNTGLLPILVNCQLYPSSRPRTS
jgi:phenol 2-monooxygenase (NADPH)